jgi:parallel beta-helix repeat protein
MGKTIFFSLILLLSIGNIVQAATRRVPAQYSDIQLAVRDCNDGDIIIVDPGTYYETINFSGKNIILTSTDPNNPDIVADTIIDADGDGSTVTFENGETSQAVLTGFTIAGGFGTIDNTLSPEVRLLWGGGVYCAGSSPTITNNVFTGNHAPSEVFGDVEDLIIGYGGAIGGVEASPTITHNIIHGNTAYAGAGIFIFGDPITRNNVIYGNSAYIGGGVIMFGGSLSNNTIAGNDASFQGGAQFGGNVHIVFSPEIPPSRILNNIISGAGSGGGITWEGDYQGGVIQFNNVWNNTPGNYGFADPTTGEFTYDGRADQAGIDGNISQNPLFIDIQAHDYHLQTGSPCVNAGDPGIVPAPGETDFDGELRIYAARIDIGAYEYVGYVKPVANAGPDQHIDLPELITLDGGGSFFYDPDGVMEFSWEQVAGSAVVMSDFAARQPTIIPESEGEYRFELVVSDGLNFSEPDEVLIIVRNRAPLADAGPDQSMSAIPSVITLDGGASYDPGGVALTYNWRQTEGPAVNLSNANADNPTFIPSQIGIYVFELVVNDGQLDSVPDIVGIVIGNRAPIADAGLPRYTTRDPVALDGSESFDPDRFGQLTYQWRQVSGPSVDIADENTATPTISGFSQTNAIQKCEFELTVSDGDLNGPPDTVEVIIVPDFTGNDLVQVNPPFEPNKPTIVAFGGGDCVMGVAMVFSDPADWYAKANFLTIGSYGPPYYQYGDALITYLSSVAPNYTQPIQTIGFSTGNMPAIDVAVRLNETYADARFAVNRISLLDAACRDFSDDIAKLLAGSVDGERCWIDNYYATAGRFYPGTLNIRFPAPPAEHSTPFVWFQQSNNPGGGARSRPVFNGGVTAGYYLSVAGPGKNLQLASDPENYYFEWNSQNDALKFYDESLYPGRIPEAVKLIGPADGTLADANGVVLSSETSENAVGYQLLFGPTAHDLNFLASYTPDPPEEIITEFPFETTYWTIRVCDEYGSTVYADPIRIKSSNVTAQVIENVNTGRKYNSIQHAIDNAGAGEEIVVAPGIYQYFENIDFKGKALTVRSTESNDPTVVAATVINGTGHGPVVTFSGAEDTNSALAGFTITGPNAGIYCSAASPLITRCNIVGNIGAGIELHNGSNPTITHCDIISNAGAGLAMWEEKVGRNINYNKPTITNCVIAENYLHGISGGMPTITNCTIVANHQSGISDSKPTIANSIIYYNGHDSDFVQIENNVTATITYTDVQGGWPGQGNIDADPLFADPDNGDYHLKTFWGRWYSGGWGWVVDPVTSPCIDAGDPATPIGLEQSPNGSIINMGVYGGTSQASRSSPFNGE